MNKPYREPQIPADDKIILMHDYAADVRASRDPRRIVRSAVVICVGILLWAAVRVLLFGGSVIAWLMVSSFNIVFFLVVLVPIGIMLRRREEERLNVADLLDDDKRGRK